MDNEGFTIVELVIILVIVGILSLSIMISITPKASVRLEAACQNLAMDLHYIQQMAMAEQVNFGISFDLNNESYFGYRLTGSTKAIDPHTKTALEVDFDEKREFNDIEIFSNNLNNAVEFDASGVPYNGSGIRLSNEGIITLRTRDGAYSKSVRIEPETGRISIQ